jgi:hypothetical protein
MGNIISGSDFTGRLGQASVYKMRGHDKLVIRSRGGATKSTIKTHPNFEATRNLNREWKLVTKVAGSIRTDLSGLRSLADYNYSGPLNALIKKIQISDTLHEKGKRSIFFSRHPDFISSFQLNRQTLFDSIIRQPLELNIDKPTAVATITVPLLQPNIHFFPNPKYAYYRLVIDMGAASDHVWDDESMSYQQVVPLLPTYKVLYTDWFPVSSTQPVTTYQQLPFTAPGLPEFSTGPDMILILGAGIQYGMPAPDNSIQPVPYAGAARIIKCV